MMSNVKIHPIPLFRTDTKLDKAKMTYLFNYGQDMIGYCYLWLIEGLGENIIVDTCASAEIASSKWFKKEEVTHIQTLENGLAKFNLECSDIDMVIVTHLHWDHIALAPRFTKAKFLVQEAELKFALNPHPLVWFYDKYLYENLKFEVIKGDSKINKQLEVLLTPGHTPGGQTVVINTGEHKVVIPGFCCILENFEPSNDVKKVTPLIPPGVLLDFIQALESMQRIKEIADIIVPTHEPKFADMKSIS